MHHECSPVSTASAEDFGGRVKQPYASAGARLLMCLKCAGHTDSFCHTSHSTRAACSMPPPPPRRWTPLSRQIQSRTCACGNCSIIIINMIGRTCALWIKINSAPLLLLCDSPSERWSDLTHSSRREGVEVGHVWSRVLSWHSWINHRTEMSN